ncbi:MAG: sigma-70 family RNA polymerase sigma factor [Balneolales bacterium]|nr:sigma-70 family RNA polymerase sigma factor [Balneolales bacterium]
MLSVNNISDSRYSGMDDQELVRLFRKDGDQIAFSELLNRYQNKIYSYIYSMVGNQEIANDIFQETFTKVITKMDDTYNEQGKWIAWVMRIAHNATIDYIRKRKRFVDVNSYGDDSDYDFYDRLEDDESPGAQEIMEFGEAKSSLMKHIGSLPKEQREVVMLRHYYEMSFKEIAELTNVSINTALGRMRYALTNLRKMFDKENGKEYEFAKRG